MGAMARAGNFEFFQLPFTDGTVIVGANIANSKKFPGDIEYNNGVLVKLYYNALTIRNFAFLRNGYLFEIFRFLFNVVYIHRFPIILISEIIQLARRWLHLVPTHKRRL